MGSKGYATPEEAARGTIDARHVRVIGVVVRGDRAIVAQLMSEHEPDTAFCYREGGRWFEGYSGNSTNGFIPTSNETGTAVIWDDDPPGSAVAGRFAWGEREQILPVDDGCIMGVFDDVRAEDWDDFRVPRLMAWIDRDGAEQLIRQPSEHFLERLRERRNQR